MDAKEITFSDQTVRNEYERWMVIIGEDPYEGTHTLGIHTVLRAHFLIVDFFSDGSGSEPVGGVGPKSVELLHSAVYRQFVGYDGRDKWPKPLEKCATLLYGVAKDHAFHDANKRTAMLCALYFLSSKCSRTPSISDREIEDFLVEVSNDQLDKYARYNALAKAGPDAEVQFIADWLRRNTREIDKRVFSVTYHQLNGILHRFKFGLENPKGNHIDVVKYSESRGLLGLGRPVTITKRISSMGFPGWKSQVSKVDLRKVRESTRLTPERGVDSQSFFNGVDPLYFLINRYADPLRRLAYR